MKNNQSKYKHLQQTSLIGTQESRELLYFEAGYAIAHRGGSRPGNNTSANTKRLVSPVNLLSAYERKQLIFSGIFFTN